MAPSMSNDPRPSTIVREAGWFALTGRWLSGILALATFGATVGMVVLGSVGDARAVEEERTARADGRDVWRFRGNEAGVDAKLCLDAARLSGVRRAGGLASGPESGNVQEYGYVGELPRILDPQTSGASTDIFASAEAVQLARFPRGYAVIDGRTLPMTVLTASARTEGFSQAVFVARPLRTRVQECWIEYEADATDTLVPLVASRLSTGNTTVEAVPRQIRPSREEILDDLRNRNLRTNAVFLSAGICLLLCLFGVLRRHEIGLYRSLGFGRGSTAVLLSLSGWAVVIPALASGAAWAGAWVVASDQDGPAFAASSASALLTLARALTLAIPASALLGLLT